MHRRHFFAVMICAFPLIMTAPGSVFAANAGGASPESAVEQYHAVLLEAMKDAKTLGIAGRYALIDKAAQTAFDFSNMAGRATGKAWRGANDTERAAMTKAFGHMSVATYAMRFNGWSGQAFETLGTDPGPRGTILVKTQISAAGDEPVALTYVMNQGEGGNWRIIDILLKGTISEMAVKKSEYANILNSKGLSGLTEALNTQADKLLTH